VFKYTQMSYLRAVILHSYSVKRKRANSHSSKLRCNGELLSTGLFPLLGGFVGKGYKRLCIIIRIITYSQETYLKAWLDFKGCYSVVVLLIHVYPTRLSTTERPSFVLRLGQVASCRLKHTADVPTCPKE